MVDFSARPNNYHPKLEAERCLKHHASNCFPEFESSHKRGRLHSSNYMSTSIPSQGENLRTQVEESALDEDYMYFLCCFQGNNGSNSMHGPIDEHKLFLDHLREDGNSYVLEMVDLRSGMPIFVKYELNDSSSDGTTEITSQSSSNIHDKRGSAYAGMRVKKSYKSRFVNHGQDIGPTPKSEVVSISSSLDQENKNGVAPVDDSYQVFMNHVRLHGDSYILELHGFSIKYEEENEELSVAEGSSVENVSHRNEPGASADNGGHKESWSDGKTSYFKTELMKILNRPYKRQEHKDLLKQATECKALHSQRHLRTTDKSYPTTRESMCYLDYYPDLAAQIHSADKYEALTLLRGFFFWLKFLSHEGAFMPWTKTPSRDLGTFPSDSNDTTLIQIS